MIDITTVAGVATIVATLIVILGLLHKGYKILISKRDARQITMNEKTSTNNNRSEGQITIPTKSDPIERLLRYFWSYPVIKISRSFAEQSWAVKESKILTEGDLIGAREKPGLGCAILSITLALKVFGEAASAERISQVVNWGIRRVSKEPPHILIDQVFYPQDSSTKEVQDFRHTLAFAVVLSSTGRLPAYRDEYLRLTLDSQRDDGGWEAGDGATVSELFTVLYAVLFLGTTLRRVDLPRHISNKAVESIELGLAWMARARLDSKLWHYDHLSDPWGDSVTSAFVLRGMSLLGDSHSPIWTECARDSLSTLIKRTLEDSCWKGTSSLQRLRAESRIAAAATQAHPDWIASTTTRELTDEYLRGWRMRAKKQVVEIPESELDLSTAIYLLDSFGTDEQIRQTAERILTTDIQAEQMS